MFYYLYKITNTVNNKIYVGIHRTKDLEDGYMGSGTLLTRAINKYGISNFKKEVLQMFQSEQDLILAEKTIVTESFINDPTTYNIALGGRGSFFHINSAEGLDQGMPAEKRKAQRKEASSRGAAATQKRFASDEELRRTTGARLSAARKALGIQPPSGYRWICNPSTKEQKYVSQAVIDEYLTAGWQLGRKGGWGRSKSI